MKKIVAILLALLALLALPACVEDDGDSTTTHSSVPGEIIVPVPPVFEDF